MASSLSRVGEAELRAMAEAVLGAADHAGVGLLIMSHVNETETCTVYASDRYASIIGRSVDEIRSMTSLFELGPPEEQARWMAIRERGAVPPTFETVILRPDGTRVPVEVSIATMTLGGGLATIAFVRDLTDRNKAVEALRVSEARFRQVVESAPEAIGLRKGQSLVYVNPAAVRLMGYDSAEELLRVPLMSLLAPADGPRLRETIERLLDADLPAPREQHRVRRKDGTIITLDVSSIRFDIDGEPASLSFARDVTERLMMEAKLVQADRFATVGTLAAGVAHEVNNPLAYVLLNLGLLAKELPRMIPPGEDLDRVMQMLGAAQDGTERVATIVRDLRAVSRWSGEGTRPVDVRRVIEATTNITSSEIRRRARLVLELHEVAPVVANEGRLGQVFLNLLLNALQAIPMGRENDNEIRIVVAPEGESYVAVRISDTGEGIPPHLLARVFDPFFTTKPAGFGTGLGLSICQSIVSAYDGTISIESQVGQGTTLVVRLPSAWAAKLGRPRRAFVAHDPQRMRVLVVDDEPVLASALGTALEGDHDVTVVTSGADALVALAADRFDVVLCDLAMPGVSGIDVYRELAVRQPGCERRLVFMTGADNQERVVEFLAKVENPRVHKPFDLEAVRAVIRELAPA